MSRMFKKRDQEGKFNCNTETSDAVEEYKYINIPSSIWFTYLSRDNTLANLSLVAVIACFAVEAYVTSK